jgi:hypothetical protein
VPKLRGLKYFVLLPSQTPVKTSAHWLKGGEGEKA